MNTRRDAGSLSNVTRITGGIRATANLTRTGVFHYGDHNELRRADEIFAKDSLDTLKGAPLTVGHPLEVNARNWKGLVVGYVSDDVRRNGIFVSSTIVVTDAATCVKIESGELRELSCGYEVELDDVAGEYEGERYDAVQRRPRYNHVALVDVGRAGPEVRVYAPPGPRDTVNDGRLFAKESAHLHATTNNKMFLVYFVENRLTWRGNLVEMK